MALARVITSSDTCARELTSALIDYGYTVEVVSPDSAPPHTADLELRVDSSVDAKLIASVRSNIRDHSASLNFVHQLRAARAPFVIELPGPMAAEAPLVGSTIAGSTILEPVIPGSAIPVIEGEASASEVAIPVREQGSESWNPPKEVLPQAPPLKPEIASAPVQALAIVPAPVQMKNEQSGQHHSGNGLGACALMLVAVVLPAALLALGMRPREISAKSLRPITRTIAITPPSQQTSAKQTAPIIVNPAEQGAPISDLVAEPAAPKPTPISPRTLTNSRTDAGVEVAKHSTKSARENHEFVARDTVTYLDERYRPAVKTKAVKKSGHIHHPPAGHIAANRARKSKQASN